MLNFIHSLYLLSAVLFIFSLKGLSSPKSARFGLHAGMGGMIITLVATCLMPNFHISWLAVLSIIAGGIVGTKITRTIPMKSLPQLIAGFHSLIGLVAVLIAWNGLIEPQALKIPSINMSLSTSSLIEMGLGAVIGALTFTGSLIAYGKLEALLPSRPIKLPQHNMVNLLLAGVIFLLLFLFILFPRPLTFALLCLPALAIGFTLTLPIGGADMPVIVSMLNSYSGWAACGIGFSLDNHLLIITGALVGSSGAILSYIMCKGMNRSFINVLLGGMGGEEQQHGTGAKVDRHYKQGSAEDIAYLLSNAQTMIVIPGYGMAVAQAQHALKEMTDALKERGLQVRFAIHPVAGRMPGHMNVLLAEASIPYEDVLELEEINNDFSVTDVVLVLGANDITNPSAKTDPTSPIYGMPILEAGAAKTVLFVKRSMSSGYAGVDNPLFYQDNTMMIFGDAKKVCEQIVKSLNELE